MFIVFMAGGTIFYCPKCYLPQDKKNKVCFNCGTRNPDPL